jgi:hypothetical protein
MPSPQDVGKLIARGIGPVATMVARPQAAGGALRRVLELAIDGYGKLPGAKASAARQLQRNGGSVDKAIESLIAHLRGYDLNDNRVRTALVMCLLGGEQVVKLIKEGKLPTSPLAIATAPVFDPQLDARVAEEVVSDLAGRIGGKNLALMLTKRVPLVGGGIGAVVDGVATRQIGKYTKSELVRRRALSG